MDFQDIDTSLKLQLNPINKQMQLNIIDSLCRTLDCLVSPDIEEKICVLDNCTGSVGKHKVISHYMEHSIICFDLLFSTRTSYDPFDFTLCKEIMEPFLKLRERLIKTGYYDPETGVSKKNRWFVFVENIKVANALFQNVAQSIKQQTGTLYTYIGFIAQYTRSKISAIYNDGYSINVQHLNALVKKISTIDNLYRQLNRFASPSIEKEEMELPLACYAELTQSYVDSLIGFYNNENQCIITNKELPLLHQLHEKLSDICFFNEEEGFSKKQDWLDFVILINTTKILLQDSLNKHADSIIKEIKILMLL